MEFLTETYLELDQPINEWYAAKHATLNRYIDARAVAAPTEELLEGETEF